MVGDRVVGTLDFFTTEVLALGESRLSALRNVQQLVSQRIAVLRRQEDDAGNARALLDTVTDLRAATEDATRVANEAVSRASTMTARSTSSARRPRRSATSSRSSTASPTRRTCSR